MRPIVSLAALALVLASGCAPPPPAAPQAAAGPSPAAPSPMAPGTGVAGAAAEQGTAPPGVKRASTCVFPTFRANQFGGAVTLTVSNDGTCGRDLSGREQPAGAAAAADTPSIPAAG